jgi:hypothetical protein
MLNFNSELKKKDKAITPYPLKIFDSIKIRLCFLLLVPIRLEQVLRSQQLHRILQ